MKFIFRGLILGILLIAHEATALAQAVTDPNVLEHGEYLARAADCEACHTVPGGQPFVGGRAFSLPFGVIYSPNITADKDTGIGTWSDDDFVRALHQGVDKAGQHLYPAFPYTSYTGMSREDAVAIKAYLFSLPPTAIKSTENTLAFPFNQRWGMALWNVVNFTEKRIIPDPNQSDDWNRGNYLANALGHCAECHTPRTISFGLNANKSYAGGEIEGWKAFNLTSDKQTGLGGWSDWQIESYLSRGHADRHGAASGPMEEVVRVSLSHLTRQDIHALTTYLRSIPPIESSGDPIVEDNPPALREAAYVPSAVNPSAGQKIFEGSCAGCHAWDGSGIQTPYAALRGNMSVNDIRASNVVQVVLGGANVHTENGDVSMPAFGNSLSNSEIASLANYVIDRFGNKQSSISAATVAEMRKVGQPSQLLRYVKWLLALAGIIVVILSTLAFFKISRRTVAA